MSYDPLDPREGESRQLTRAFLLGPMGRLGSPSLGSNGSYDAGVRLESYSAEHGDEDEDQDWED